MRRLMFGLICSATINTSLSVILDNTIESDNSDFNHSVSERNCSLKCDEQLELDKQFYGNGHCCIRAKHHWCLVNDDTCHERDKRWTIYLSSIALKNKCADGKSEYPSVNCSIFFNSFLLFIILITLTISIATLIFMLILHLKFRRRMDLACRPGGHMCNFLCDFLEFNLLYFNFTDTKCCDALI